MPTVAEEYVNIFGIDDKPYQEGMARLRAANGRFIADNEKASASINSFTSKISSSFQSVGTSISSFGASLTKMAAPLIALGGLATAAASDVNSAFRIMRVGGAEVGPQLDAMKESFARIFSTVPAGAKDVATALNTIKQITGDTGKGLEDLATQELNLSRITGSDLKGQIEATTKAFNNYGLSASQQGPALDYLFKVSQQTGIGVTELAQQMASSGGIARAAGLDFQTTAALVGSLSKAGLDASTVMGGFQKALTAIAKKDPGADPAQAIQGIVAAIKNAGTEAQQNAVAVQYFGRSGIQMAAAIRDGRLDIEALTKSLQGSHDSINKAADDTRTFGETMTIMKNRVELALAPLGRNMTTVLKSFMPDLEKAIGFVTNLSNRFRDLDPSTQKAVGGLILLAGAIGPATFAFGKVATSISAIAPLLAGLSVPLAIAGVAIGLLAVGYATNLGGMQDSVNNFISAVSRAWQDHSNWLVETTRWAWNQQLEGIRGTFQDISRVIDSGTALIEGRWSDMLQNMSHMTIDALTLQESHFASFASRVANLISKAITGFDANAGLTKALAGPDIEGSGFLTGVAKFGQKVYKAWNGVGTGAAKAFGDGVKSGGVQIEETLDDLFTGTVYGKGGNGGGGKLPSLAKAKGAEAGKSLADGFKEGLAGFQDAFAVILQASGEQVGSLTDALGKKARAGLEILSRAFKDVVPSVNEFLSAQGIAGKVTAEQLEVMRIAGDTSLLAYTESWLKTKEAVNAAGIEMAKVLPVSLKAINDFLKEQGFDVQITQESWLKMSDASKTATIALGNMVKGQQDLRAEEVASKDAIENLTVTLLAHKMSVNEALLAYNQHKITFQQYLDALHGVTTSQQIVIESTDNLGSAIRTMGERFDQALLKTGIPAIREFIEANNRIESTFSTYEQYWTILGKTGQELQNLVERDVRTELSKIPDITTEQLNKAIEAHRRAAIQLPGIWNDVFNKMSSQAKSWASALFGVLDTIPSAFGSTVKKVTSTINEWVTFFDKILALLHKFSSSIPGSIGDAIGQIINVFKKATPQATTAAGAIGIAFGTASTAVAAAGASMAASNAAIGSTAQAAGAAVQSAMNTAAGAYDKAKVAAANSAQSQLSSISKLAGEALTILGGVAMIVSGHAQGGLSGGLQGAIGGLMAGATIGSMILPGIGTAIGAGIGAITGFLAGFFGGGKTAAQKEAERLQNEKLKADIAASAQATVNAAIQGFQQALVFFDQLDQFTAPRKAKFQQFWKAMGKLMDGFVELAKKFQNENLDKMKAVAEAIGAVAQSIAAAPAAFDAINLSFTIPDSQFDVFFSNLDRFMDKFFARSDVWIEGTAKRAKKVADRLISVVDLIAPFTEGLKGLLDLKAVPEEALNIFDQMLERMVQHIGALADKFDKGWLKTMAFFAEKSQAALGLWKDATDAIRATVDVPRLDPGLIDVVVSNIEAFIARLITAAQNINSENLAKAASIAQSILPIAAALKAWAEAAGVVQSYVAVASHTWDDITKDFNLAVSLMLSMLADAIRFIPDAIKFEDTMKTIADHLKQGLAYITEGIQAAQSAFLGLVNVMSSPQQPIVDNGLGGQSSVTTSSLAGLSGGYLTSAPPSKGHSSVTYQVNVNVNGNLIHQSNVTDAVIEALVRAQRAGRLKAEVV